MNSSSVVEHSVVRILPTLGVVKEIEVIGIRAFAWRYKEPMLGQKGPMQGPDLAEIK
jgi:hypothetical protein